ncbi:metallophosphoesterase [Nonomuraea sp. NPDC049709]|uniref:metallophosphoesterase n=1 Tax=Nonomuraea sp. NPDC049709 TaxID=3154736 RepID=UPI00343E404F
MTGRRALERIVATTDVHSSFDQPLPMLTYLHAARKRALVVDCGDFFEGTGYYRLGDGHIERQALALLYDVIAPGNHGWRHHFEPDLRALTVSANAIDSDTGEPLFRPIHIARIEGRRVGVTAVLGEQAFTAIPRAERTGHHVISPGPALHELKRRYRDAVDDWIVLSHSSFEHDLALAAACPFVSVIFSGHCHSEQYGPVQVRNTLVVKGHELGAGYAEAAPVGQSWNAHARAFPDRAPMAKPVARLHSQLNAMQDVLANPLGPLTERFRHTLADRREILTLIARQLRARLNAEAVVLNETCLRPVRLGPVLRRGDLLAIEPFANQLVHTTLPSDCDPDTLAAQTGPLIVVGDLRGGGVRHAVTTRYLAETYLGGRWNRSSLSLAEAVQAVLTEQTGDRP